MKRPRSQFTNVSFVLCLIAAGLGVSALALPARAEAIIWDGPTITFTKADWADWTDPNNQDRITNNVWLTRADTRQLFNIKIEAQAGGYGSNSPLGTEWARGSLADYATLSYGNLVDFAGGWPADGLVGVNGVLHLITDDIYIGIKFTSWTTGAGGGTPAGGGFSYVRTTYVAPAPPDLTWTGGTSQWSTNPVTNWKDLADNPAVYKDGNSVLFDDTNTAGSAMVDISVADVAPSKVVFSNTAAGVGTYTLTGTHGITGATGLTKAGNGVLVVANANTYAGATNISDGILRLGAADALPHGAGKNIVVVGGTLDANGFSQTLNGLGGGGAVTTGVDANVTLTVGDGDKSSSFAGLIEDGGGRIALVKMGGGTLTLSGANTYSGGTTVSGGTLVLANREALGAAAVTLDGGASFHTSGFEGNSAGGALPNDFVLSGGTVTVDVSFGNKDIWINTSVSGNGGFLVTGDGNRYPGLMLSGAKTFKGGVTLGNGARVTIDNVASLGAGALRADDGTGALRVAGDVTAGAGVENNVVIAENATLNLEVNANARFSGQVSDEGAGGKLVKTGDAALTLTGGGYMNGSLAVNRGTLTVGAGAAVGTAWTNVINTVTNADNLAVSKTAYLPGVQVYASGAPFTLSGSNVGNPTNESRRTITVQGGTVSVVALPGTDTLVNSTGRFGTSYDPVTGVWTMNSSNGMGWIGDPQADSHGWHYTEMPPGDFDVSVHVTSDGWQRAGLMVRDTTTGTGNYAAVWDAGGNGNIAYNVDGAGNTYFENLAGGGWVRIVKNGSTITLYKGSDGTTWTQLKDPLAYTTWGPNTYLGLDISYRDAVRTFDHVTFLPAVTQVDLSTTDIVAAKNTALVLPAPTTLGNLALKGGSLSVTKDITMAADSIYRWEFDDTAHKVAVTGSLAFDAGWKLAIVDAGGKPAPGVKYDLFTYTGGCTGYSAPDITALPDGWLTPTVNQESGRIYLLFGLIGDVNGDYVVDAADYVTLKRNMGMSSGAQWADGDLNGDHQVTWADLQLLMSNFGAGSGTPATAPEPATLFVMMAAGLPALLKRRRRVRS